MRKGNEGMNLTVDDVALVRLAIRGDKDALAKLFEKNQQNMLATALYICGNKHDAEDAVQNSFIEIHGSIGKLRSPDKINAYMLVILRRQCYKTLARRKQDYLLVENDEAICPALTEGDSSPEKYAGDRALQKQIIEIIKSLPPRSREVIFYHYYDEMSVKEIAKLIGVKIGTVTSILTRARTQIKEKLLSDKNKEILSVFTGGAFLHKAISADIAETITNANIVSFQTKWKMALEQVAPVKAHASVIKNIFSVGAGIIALVLLVFLITRVPSVPTVPKAPEVTAAVVFYKAGEESNYLNPDSVAFSLEGAVPKTVSWTLTDMAAKGVVLSGEGASADLSSLRDAGVSGRYFFAWHIVDTDGFQIDITRELEYSH